MKLHNIRQVESRERKRRVGRGPGSGRGKTAGRGTKGQKSRSGFNIPRRFEGGQTPLVQRLPKSGGFTSRRAKHPIVHVEKVNELFKAGDRVSPRDLLQKGLVTSLTPKVKLIGPGKLAHFVRLENILLTRRIAAALPQLPKVRSAKSASGQKTHASGRPAKRAQKTSRKGK